jgi:capsular exopolysaccharide synthesis family protein
MATQVIKKPQSQQQSAKSSLRITEFLYVCVANWKWFLLSLVICLGIAFLYLKTTAPTYSKTASILIKTDKNDNPISSESAMFQDLGIYQGNSSVVDEMVLIKSPDIMREVVRRLNLETSYTVDGTFRTIGLYGSNLPVQVNMPELAADDYASFKLNLQPNGDFTISDMAKNGKSFGDKELKGRIGNTLKTPFGMLTVTPAEKYNVSETQTINVSRVPTKSAAAGYLGGLSVKADEDSWDIVNLAYVDTDPQRAEDILRAVIACYNDRWMKDKRDLADNSSKFIDERIQLLQSELGDVDNDISSFKSNNLVPDVDAAAGLYMSQATQASVALRDLRNQEYMVKYIRSYLRNSENNNKLLPTSSGISSANLSGQISQYNTKILERNSLVAQSSTTNPLVAEMDQQLTAMRGALVASLDNEMVAIQEQIRSQEGVSGTATSQIANNPKQAKYLLSVERQQKVKESLYLYLLQKREENQLNQAFTSYNTRIIREADGSNAPIAPNTQFAFLIAFAAGLVIPALIIFINEVSVHVVRGRKDIKDMKIPFAGELPIYGANQSISKRAIRKKGEDGVIAVKENSRNAINEAFRVVRTNIEFMIGNDPSSRVIMMTSANPGSGKTFIAYNLAKSFSIKNKRVIVVDLDMRKASLSKYAKDPSTGISDYLANRVNDIQSLIHQADDAPNLSVIPVGTIPPNPTELLFSDRLQALIADLRLHYDYIFLDCPPVEVVADASIVSKFADNTLFVIRAGLLDLSMVPVIEQLYEEGKYPSMSLILNGTLNPRGRYASRYGNPYSYGYGYGSSYRYGDNN